MFGKFLTDPADMRRGSQRLDWLETVLPTFKAEFAAGEPAAMPLANGMTLNRFVRAFADLLARRCQATCACRGLLHSGRSAPRQRHLPDGTAGVETATRGGIDRVGTPLVSKQFD
jgi:hypothetical protein